MQAPYDFWLKATPTPATFRLQREFIGNASRRMRTEIVVHHYFTSARAMAWQTQAHDVDISQSIKIYPFEDASSAVPLL